MPFYDPQQIHINREEFDLIIGNPFVSKKDKNSTECTFARFGENEVEVYEISLVYPQTFDHGTMSVDNFALVFAMYLFNQNWIVMRANALALHKLISKFNSEDAERIATHILDEMKTYGNCDFNGPDSQDAWDKMIAFLKSYIKS